MKFRFPKDSPDAFERGQTKVESTKLSRKGTLAWIEEPQTEKTEQVHNRRSIMTSLHRRLSRTSNSMPAKISDGKNASVNTTEDKTKVVDETTPPANEHNDPPAFQSAAQKAGEQSPSSDTTQTPYINVQQNSALLDLPTEIRLRIFDYMLKPELPICLMVSTNVYIWGQGLPRDIASCARVCKDLNGEVQDIIWERLIFKIRPDNGRGLSSSSRVGKAESCQLLRKIRYAEICFPITGIHQYDDADRRDTIIRRMELCCAMLERNKVLRVLWFNCDTTAFIGEHDDEGVELFARTFSHLLMKKMASGVIVKLMSTKKKRSSSAVCIKVFRECGLMD